jgi:hypothetical protein
MMKVGRVPKWWLVESNTCARAIIPVTMRMMPARRLLVLDSLLITLSSPDEPALVGHHQVVEQLHVAGAPKLTVPSWFPAATSLDLLARHSGDAGGGGGADRGIGVAV